MQMMVRMVVALLLASAAAPAWAQEASAARVEYHEAIVERIPAPRVSSQPIRVRTWLPPGYRSFRKPGYPVLYINDGQDMEAVRLEETLTELYRAGRLQPLIIVAIDMPQDRAAAYGVSDRRAGRSLIANTHLGQVGAKAQPYARWLVKSLVPHVDRKWNTRADATSRMLLGWSLGGLQAFSSGWQYPAVFGVVAAFSPSFWVSGDERNSLTVERSRLAQELVDHGTPRRRNAAGQRFFFAAGGAEETDDRDGDGVIDVIDDVLDLMRGWKSRNGEARKGLAQWGYSLDTDYHLDQRPRSAAAVFLRVPDGRHDQATWARMLPVFLTWAAGADASRATPRD